MERHANYALVGIVTILLLIMGLVFVVWLGQTGFQRETDRYRIVFVGAVRGLTEGGDVQFNGIKVGEIERIHLDRQDPNRVFADVKIRADTPVQVDSVAAMETQNISGIRIIQINPGAPGKPLLRAVSKEEWPIIPSKPDSLSQLLKGGGQFLDGATEAVNRVNRLLSDRTIANMEASIADIRLTADEVARNRAMVRDAASAIARMDRAAADIEATSKSVRAISDGDGKRAFADIAAGAGELREAIKSARTVIARLDTESDKVATTTLPNVNATLLSIQETADNLDQLVRDVRRDPKRLIARDRSRELKVPE